MGYAITAAGESTQGRIALTVSGGVPGDVLYLFRRDSAGVGVVRDTSEGTVVWPASTMPNGSVTTDITGWGRAITTSSTLARNSGAGYDGAAGFARITYSAAITHAQSLIVGDVTSRRSPVVAGVPVFVAIAARSNRTPTITPRVTFYDEAGAQVGSSVAIEAAAALVANTWREFSGVVTPPAGATRLAVRLDAASLAWAINDTFDGDEARVQPLTTIYDYEARQGEPTDYLLADGEGVQRATVRVDVPTWGTWLKAPGRPDRNTRCRFAFEGEVVQAARRALLDIEGASLPLALSEARGGKGGEIHLLALDTATATGLETLLSTGGTLMLDTDPQWRVPYRYISVGDVGSTRPGSLDGVLGLTSESRLYALRDTRSVAMPIGITAIPADRTYDQLATLFASYAALAATTATYDDLVTGA